jgi:hypothetical protein
MQITHEIDLKIVLFLINDCLIIKFFKLRINSQRIDWRKNKKMLF